MSKKELENLKENSNEFADHLSKFIDEVDNLIEEGKGGFDSIVKLWSSLEDWVISVYNYDKKDDNVDIPDNAKEVAALIKEDLPSEE